MYYLNGSKDWRTYDDWKGIFLCDNTKEIKLPNGYFQVFVIGLGNKAYTRWESRSGRSDWTWLDAWDRTAGRST
jgi:hypothetical protein